MAVARVGLQSFKVESGEWKSYPVQWVRNDCLTSLTGNRRQLVFGGNGYSGGAAVFDLESKQQQGVHRLPLAVKRKIGRPARDNRMVKSLAIDGPKLWVGGLNYLAQVDLKSGNVDAIAEFGGVDEELTVGRIEISAGELWVAIDKHLHRIPRTAWMAGAD